MTPTGWTCPDCGRVFGRSRQAHECAPAMTLEDYFATGPPHERAVFDAVLPRKFAELRPRDRWAAVSFALDRRATHRTITRKVVPDGDTHWHTANVAAAADVDEGLADLLVEAYERAASQGPWPPSHAATGTRRGRQP